MVNILVDDIPITVPEGTTILEAAKVAGMTYQELCEKIVSLSLEK